MPPAQKYGVPPSTLRRRLLDKPSPTDFHQGLQLLSHQQESVLAQWFHHEEVSGRTPTRQQLVAMARAILREAGEERPLGIIWIERFFRRNQQLKEKPPVKGSTRPGCTYKAFFNRLERLVADKNISPGNIANMEELGLYDGGARARPRRIRHYLTGRTTSRSRDGVMGLLRSGGSRKYIYRKHSPKIQKSGVCLSSTITPDILPRNSYTRRTPTRSSYFFYRRMSPAIGLGGESTVACFLQ